MSTKASPFYGTTSAATTPSTTRPTTQAFTHTPRSTTLLSTRRPWREFLDPSSFSLPYSYQDALSRIKTNLNHFRFNYTVIMLVILFLSLLYHPVSLIVFILIFILWYALYFSKEQERHIIVFGYVFDDRVVVVVLSLVTIVCLVLTHVGLNVLVSLIIVVVLVGLHAAFRIVENLYVDVESVNDGDGDVGGGLFNVVGGHQMKPYTRF